MRFVVIVLIAAAPALADPAKIEGIDAEPGQTGWTFHVTLRHGDTGWDDYADGWRVESPDGAILGERPLAHPHENEQPFTRSQSGIQIPDEVETVHVRASTNVEGWSEDVTVFELPR